MYVYVCEYYFTCTHTPLCVCIGIFIYVCTENNLVVTDTLFKLKNRYKKHPRSKDQHLVDYIFIKKRDMKDVSSV